MKTIESFHMKCQQRILGIRWHDFFSVTLRPLYALLSHLCLTGLPPEVAMPYSDLWQDCQITFQHTRPCYAKSSYRSVDPQTLHGNVHQVDHVPNGPTNFAAITTMFPLRLCGGKLLVAVTRERRCGPSRLRVNDDDHDVTATGTHMPYWITQWYLPPGRGDIPALTRTEAGTRFIDPRGMQG